MSNDKDPRYEREIKNILNDMPDFLHEGESREPLQFRRPSKRKSRPRAMVPSFRLSLPYTTMPQKFIILAVLCLVGSYVGRYFVPQIAPYLGIAATVFFILALVRAIADNRGPRYENKWRGQVLNLPSDSPEWQRRLQQWWWRVRFGGRRRNR